MIAFSENPISDFVNQKQVSIISKILVKGKDYILQVDEQEFIEHLYYEYLLEPLTIIEESEAIDTPRFTQERIKSPMYGGGYYDQDVYTFTIRYNYTGSAELFNVRPNPCTMSSWDIEVVSPTKTVAFKFSINKQDPEEFKREKSKAYSGAFANVENVNKNANDFNRNLRDSITRAFQKEKSKYLKENDFFAAINVKVNPNTKSVFTAPTITKKVIPQPSVSKGKEFSSEPTMSTEMYNDILKVIYESGKSMEKKPALYLSKNEEGLRDQFLFVLETRYEGTTATGETFNRSGKTDIMLKYANDGSNLFVAECKFWHGASEFLAAISQLFDRYLTWRDSKAALILFVQNKDFSTVLATIKKEAKSHSLFIKENGNRGESSFSYLFCLPQDKQKQVYFEIMAFHYDK